MTANRNLLHRFSEMRAFPAIVLFPRRASRCLKARPRWLVAFAVLAALHIAAQWVEHEAVTREVLRRLPPSATSADLRAAREFLDADLPPRLLMEPPRLAASWSAFAGLLWLMCRLLPNPLPLRWSQVWALVVHAEAIPTLFVVLDAALTGFSGVFRPDALCREISLGALVSVAVPVQEVFLLSSLNLCTLWFVGVLGSGLAVLSESSRRTGILVAGLSWGISAAGTPLVLHLLQTTLHIVL